MTFKPGDRVAVYDTSERLVGEVVWLSEAGNLNVRINANLLVTAHPKQCRRLVKRERKRIRVICNRNESAVIRIVGRTPGDWFDEGEWEFIEVRGKK